MTRNYESDLKRAVEELGKLEARRERIEIEIAKSKKRVAALSDLVVAEGGSGAGVGLVQGLTDACRTVLRAAGRSMLPIEVRDAVLRLGLPDQVNLLASVYTALRRLKEMGEVVEDPYCHRNPGGSSVLGYQWAGPVQRLGYPNPTNTQKR